MTVNVVTLSTKQQQAGCIFIVCLAHNLHHLKNLQIFRRFQRVAGCALKMSVGGTMLTLMFSSAAIVLWASSSSVLSWDTRFSKYFLSLLRLSDCKQTPQTQCSHVIFLCEVTLDGRNWKSYIGDSCLTAMCKCSPSKLLACFVPVCVSRRLQGRNKSW